MPVSLLDVNVLLALAWPNHVHHESAHTWFAARGGQGWASCALTQTAFVRLSAQPSVVKTTIALSDALAVLEANVSTPGHEFWPLSQGLVELTEELRDRLVAHRQVTDAVLLDLAIRNGGCLATFDLGIQNLLAPDSQYRSALEIVPLG